MHKLELAFILGILLVVADAVGTTNEDDSVFYLSRTTPFVTLNATDAFAGLAVKQQLYAHYMARAAWDGALVVLLQVSPESPLIFTLLHKFFSAHSLDDIRKFGKNCAFSDDDWQAFLVYSAGFFASLGNYRDFGDSKFIPQLDKTKFSCLLNASSVDGLSELWPLVGDRMFSLTAREKRLGFSPEGVTTYLSSSVTKQDAELSDRFMKSKGLEGWNTRLFKTVSNGSAYFEIRVASVETTRMCNTCSAVLAAVGHVLTPFQAIAEAIAQKWTVFEGASFRVTHGDYSPLLTRVVPSLQHAREYANDEREREMLDAYARYFRTGELDAHKNASRLWVADKGPPVESYIGFIENYRDPAGVRSEFEGFVAGVNKDESAAFAKLVEDAPAILPRLPWGNDYEKDSFSRPDFTSLDVVAFAGSGLPSGINIPNYDDIRMKDGFKNVALGNVVSATSPNEKIQFLSDPDKAVFRPIRTLATLIQVGLHELLGHGSGKIFIRYTNGSFNFDASVRDLLTGGKITSWYEEGETWSTKFGKLSNPYEECRAEGVAYFLSTFDDVLKIFTKDAFPASDVMYVNWLARNREALVGMEHFSPSTKSWGQAHSHARYVLLRVLLEAGEGLMNVTEIVGEDKKPDLLLSIDRQKILSVGRPALGKFLQKLQYYKATANFTGGKELFDRYTVVDTTFSRWRDIVVARRAPRKVFVQGNTILSGGSAKLIEYDPSASGLIRSVVERYKEKKIYDDLMRLVANDRSYFRA